MKCSKEGEGCATAALPLPVLKLRVRVMDHKKFEFDWEVTIKPKEQGIYPIEARISVTFPRYIREHLFDSQYGGKNGVKWLSVIYTSTHLCNGPCPYIINIKSTRNYRNMKRAGTHLCPYIPQRYALTDSMYLMCDTPIYGVSSVESMFRNQREIIAFKNEKCIACRDSSELSESKKWNVHKINVEFGRGMDTHNMKHTLGLNQMINGDMGTVVLLPPDTDIDRAKLIFSKIADMIGSYYVETTINFYIKSIEKGITPLWMDNHLREFMRIKSPVGKKHSVRQINMI